MATLRNHLLDRVRAGLCAGCLLAAPAASAESQPDWRARAALDVAGMREALLQNHAAVYVSKDSAHFRSWLAAGYAAAVAQLPAVADQHGYAYLLKGYTGGFRDSHIAVSISPASGAGPAVSGWPGLSTRWRDGRYAVAYVDPARASTLPPRGAVLIGCDGQSVERIARRRLDRYEANLDLETGRYFSAPKLLWDMGDPFAGPTPAACTFRVAGTSRSYALTYSAPSAADILAATNAAAGAAKPALSIVPWKTNGWWIGLPSMLEDQDWATFFAAAERHRSDIRNAAFVVIDVRGDRGGDSLYADRLARILWGEAMVAAHAPDEGAEVYRVSPLNRKFFADSLQEFAEKDPTNEDVPEFTELVARMDAAAKAGVPLVTIPHPRLASAQPLPANPMKGRVILLTDYVCNSACLDLLDLYTRMPNTTQAGVTTNADTIFMEVSRQVLPSGMATIGFGHKAWIARPRGSNVTYRPPERYTYRGDLGDDDAVRAWVAQSFGVE